MKTNLFKSLMIALTVSTAAQAQKYEFIAAVEVMDPTCFGSQNGYVEVTPFGGFPPYTYAWSNGDTTSTLTGLSAGTYGLTITDSNQGTLTTSVVLTEPAELAITANVQDATTFGGSDGQIDVNVWGLASAYTFNWTTTDGSGIVSNTISQFGLSEGFYSLTITNANGCSDTESFYVGQANPVLNPMGTGTINTAVLSLNSHQDQSIVYPNPSSGTVHFRAPKNVERAAIYDQFGMVITEIDFTFAGDAAQTAELAPGTYIALFFGQDGTTQKEIISVR